MLPDDYCQQRAAQSGSSFYYSFFFLDKERRLAMTAFYAFCRKIDDVVDETADTLQARAQLNAWRKEIDALFSGKPKHLIGRALLPHIKKFELDARHFYALIDGMEMDLNKTRYETYSELTKYCWHVAGVVGLVSAKIFGVSQKETLEYAQRLGLAFQLTNILRDISEDAQRGRIYVPREELKSYGVSEDDILNLRHSKNFESLMRFSVKRAQKIYDEAFSLLPQADRKAQRPGIIMAGIYREILNDIQRQNYRVLNKRVRISAARKLWLAGKAYCHG